MTLEELYYFHSFLNYKLFGGKLEAVIIKAANCFSDSIEGIEAQIETELDPFIIFFNKELLNAEPLYIITVLLHEMIHQYNRQRGIDDTDRDTGEHNAAFVNAAKRHGLEMRGYRLTDEAKSMIEEQLERYDRMKNIEALPF